VDEFMLQDDYTDNDTAGRVVVSQVQPSLPWPWLLGSALGI